MTSSQNNSYKTYFTATITALLISLIVSLSFYRNANATEQNIVLITNQYSEISSLQNRDIRRIYLGLNPKNSAHIYIPIINLSDKTTYKHFLKNIMFLTESSYKRKLIKRVFRQGADEIKTISSDQELINYLTQNPGYISFMPKQNALKYGAIKIVQELW